MDGGTTAGDAGPPLRLDGFPRAILHFDGDAFFAAVEQAADPALRGRPVVTGKERGIIACASYEAKARGVRRGIALGEARRLCPDLVVLPSDYETYSLFSQRMFDIARRFTPDVEAYSIDEGFAELTGLRRLYRASYAEIARRFQAAAEAELGLTVSIGLSLSKGLAKLASDFRKPRGFTAVAGRHLHRFLARCALSDVWGFGPNTVALLQRHGLRTALDFVRRPEAWAGRLLGKPGREIWRELRGDAVHAVQSGAPPLQASLSKGKTFAAPSADRDFVYAKLLRNVESAFIKLRRHGLRARTVTVALRRQDFGQASLGARLTRATAATHEAVPAVRALFDALYAAGVPYRATMVLLEELESDPMTQPELFDDPVRIEKMAEASRLIDRVNRRYGKHRLGLGTGLFLPMRRPAARDAAPRRKTDRLPGETERRRVGIPLLRLPV